MRFNPERVLTIKEKAIFLCDRGIIRVQNVYSNKTIKELSESVDLDEFVYGKDNLDPQAASQTQIIFSTWGMPEFNRDEIKRLFPNLKIIFYAAGSVQHFAKPFIDSGIRVVSAWAANAIPVAEFTFSQIILANKGFLPAQRIIKEQGYEAARIFTDLNFKGTFDCTVGIIGAGMIGRKVIEMLRACDIRTKILVFDPFLPEESANSLGVKLCSLETLFEESNVISNHLANNPRTRGMLNYNLFQRMKPSAAFINTGRGAQVIEADLIRALTEYPNRSAILDVTYPEPPEKDHEFYKMPNVFISCHISGSLGDETYRMGEYILKELKLYLANEKPQYEVTRQMLETMA